MRTYLFIISVLGFFLGIFPIKAEEAKVEKSWYENLKVSGFVDVYYMYNKNNKEGRDPDTTGGLNSYNKQVQIAAIELDIEKIAEKDSPWGFRVDLQNGTNNPYQENPYNGSGGTFNMNLLQQAYVSFYFNILNGMTIDAGKMATHIGYEVIESKDNMNYNVGYIFFNTVPFINTGARVNLSLTDDWSLGIFQYNSAGGTGSDSASYAAGKNGYGDGDTKKNAVGTQVSGNLIDGFLDITWNSLYGIDGTTGRHRNQIVWASEYLGVPLSPKDAGSSDYWMINNVIVEVAVSEQFAIVLDYTEGEKSGAAGNAFDPATPIFIEGSVNPLSLTRDDADTKYIYRTYGIWMKYKFTENFALALRYEKIDDSRNGGALGVAGKISDQERYDLQFNNQLDYKSFYLGSAQTFTVTPTYNWGENVVIKLDLRRDEAQGSQFVNEKGESSGHQNGATLGIVAKF